METIPLRRPSTPADVANACCYLASDEAAFITGIDLEACFGILRYIPFRTEQLANIFFVCRLMVDDVSEYYCYEEIHLYQNQELRLSSAAINTSLW